MSVTVLVDDPVDDKNYQANVYTGLNMAGVGRGALRPSHQGNKQSLIVIALLVAIVIVGVNYWSISTKHRRLMLDFDNQRQTYKVTPKMQPEVTRA